MPSAATVKACFDLCRISNLPTVWTNVLCAIVLATGGFSWSACALPGLALSCHYLAGMCLNDLCDAAHDTLHRPTRPMPSGRVSPKGCLTLTISLFATGCALLAACGSARSVYAALLLIGFIVWYDLDHKANRYSVFLMASCRFMVFVVASLAVSGRVPPAVVLAGAVQFAYVVCISAVARLENSRPGYFPIPVIPFMLAGISLVDGFILAVSTCSAFLAAGAGGAVLTLAAQKWVRGD